MSTQNVDYGCGGDDEDEDELEFTKNVFLFSPKTIFKGRRNILIPFKSRRIREFFFFAGNFLQLFTKQNTWGEVEKNARLKTLKLYFEVFI